MATVHDVAAYVLNKANVAMSTMKLQKLVYYSQAWNLVWNEDRLFEEPIEAWVNGPVVYDLYTKHRGQFSVREWRWGDPDALTAEERGTVDAVLEAYGKYNGQQLSALSHDEEPWKSAREGLGPSDGSTRLIEPDVMQEYYSAVAADTAAHDV